MTRSRANAIHDKMNSFLYMCDLDPTLDGTLPHANALCILRFDPQELLHGRKEAGQEDGRKEGREEEAPGSVGTEPSMVPGSIQAAPGVPGTVPAPIPDHPEAHSNRPVPARYTYRI